MIIKRSSTILFYSFSPYLQYHSYSCHVIYPYYIHPSIRPSVHCQSHQTIYISCPVLSCPVLSSHLLSSLLLLGPPPPLSLNPCLLPFQTLTDFTSSFSLFLSSSLIPLSLFHSPGFDFDFSLHNLQTFIHLYTTFIFISCLLYFSHYSSARSSVHLFSGS